MNDRSGKVRMSHNTQTLQWTKPMGMTIVLILLAAVLVRYFHEPQELSPVVTVSGGKLQGVVSYSRNGNKIYEFLSVPYAKKPVGNLRFESFGHDRFQSPKPAEKWEGVLQVHKITPKCIQIDLVTLQKYGQEDCLYLNIYVPKVGDSKSLLPVMVYIHGGIFMYGGADLFGPKYYADENVILVTISYRVASFGFLNTGDGHVRGNMGLKDQVMSLKWIQKNIKSFGGNPNKVTLFGESAGASSVHLHLMSPMSKGLFHRAISQSGTAISPFVLSRHPIEQSKMLGKRLGCPTESSKELVSCLKQIDADSIIETHRVATDLLHNLTEIYSPSIEVFNDSEAFLTDDPKNLLKDGKIVSKVPWINGVNSDEGLMLSAVIVENDTVLNGLENDWNNVVHKLIFYEKNDAVSSQAKQMYFGNTDKIGSPENLDVFTTMVSDRAIFWPASEAALLQSKVSPVYLYYYSHINDFSFAHFVTLFRRRFHYTVELTLDLILQLVNKYVLGRKHHQYGCCHADEQFVMFNTLISPDLTPQHGELYEMSKDVVKLWADFAKKGRDLSFRGVSWHPVDPNQSPLTYLLINSSSKIIDEPFESRIKFWRENPVV